MNKNQQGGFVSKQMLVSEINALCHDIRQKTCIYTKSASHKGKTKETHNSFNKWAPVQTFYLRDKKAKHHKCSSGPAVNIMHTGRCPASLK